jgi:hypothetical protein
MTRATNLYLTTATPTTNQNSLAGTATAESEVFQRSLLAASIANSKKNGLKKAGQDAPPVNIGWDSHMPVVSDI